MLWDFYRMCLLRLFGVDCLLTCVFIGLRDRIGWPGSQNDNRWKLFTLPSAEPEDHNCRNGECLEWIILYYTWARMLALQSLLQYRLRS